MTLRNNPSMRLTRADPPFCMGFGWSLIVVLTVQIWAYCAGGPAGE